MKRHTVDSSNVTSIGYDRKSRLLEIEFRGGRVYQYEGVPLSLYERFRSASSKGQFVAAEIAGRYAHSRIAG